MACSPYERMIAFRLREFEKIDQDAYGIYGFWFKRRCIYVGKAAEQPIAIRLVQHWKGSHNQLLRNWIEAKGKELKIAYKYIPEIAKIDILERYCINKYQPETNKIRYKFHFEIPEECVR